MGVGVLRAATYTGTVYAVDDGTYRLNVKRGRFKWSTVLIHSEEVEFDDYAWGQAFDWGRRTRELIGGVLRFVAFEGPAHCGAL